MAKSKKKTVKKWTASELRKALDMVFRKWTEPYLKAELKKRKKLPVKAKKK